MSEYDASNDESVVQLIEAYEQRRREEDDAVAHAQYINFGILAVILLIVVFVVAFAAPFIAQKLVVGAILGW